MNIPIKRLADSASRRHFIGGSDTRIIMRQDEKALIRLWQETRGEVGPEDLSANLIVQLGVVTEGLTGLVRPQRWRCRENYPARARISVRRRLPLGSFKTNSSAATVFLDEFNPGGLNRFPQSHSNFVGHPRTKASFEALDCRE
jgi:hypothetical protein